MAMIMNLPLSFSRSSSARLWALVPIQMVVRPLAVQSPMRGGASSTGIQCLKAARTPARRITERTSRMRVALLSSRAASLRGDSGPGLSICLPAEFVAVVDDGGEPAEGGAEPGNHG